MCRRLRLRGVSELAPVAVAARGRSRARILEEQLGGLPLPVGALAARVGVAPSTASEHVSSARSARLVAVAPNGRQREVGLAGAHVADALEALSRLADPPPAVGLGAVIRREALRHARSCSNTGPAGSAPRRRTRSSTAGPTAIPTSVFAAPPTTSSSPRPTSTSTRSASAAARSPGVQRLDRAPPARRGQPRRRALLDGLLGSERCADASSACALDVTPEVETESPAQAHAHGRASGRRRPSPAGSRACRTRRRASRAPGGPGRPRR